MADREHVEERMGCWCQPRYFIPCEDCESVGNTSCWKCEDGRIEITAADADTREGWVIVVHNYGDAAT